MVTSCRRSAASVAARALVLAARSFAVAATFASRYAAAAIATTLLVAAPVNAQADDPLSFFKNYFVTGDYVVRGASLFRMGVGGTAVANIPSLGGPDGVPPKSDLLAAFLYVQTAESVQGSGIDHAKFDGIDLGPFTATGSTDPASGTYAKPLVNWGTAPTPCWSVSFPGGRKLMTYRVDVLRFLPIDPTTGKHDLTRTHSIAVPDAGQAIADAAETTYSEKPRALGASLVVVYRDPTKPFSAVVIYDGSYRKQAQVQMDQPIRGFYQASNASPTAKMTHVVTDALLSEQVLLDGKLIATNPYKSADDKKWANAVFDNLPLTGGAGATTVTVARNGVASDCVTFAAMVFSTTVQASDGDGLVDAWKKSPPPIDPRGNPLPDLGAMGASKGQKDLFVQIGYMSAAEGTMYGGVAKPQHTHLPSQDALKKVADAFAKQGVRVHFDVGNRYQGPSYIVPAALAKGGQGISETQACPDPANLTGGKPIECATLDANGVVNAQLDIPGQYPKYPGTVGWKTGFQLIRDELLGFDPARKDIFHYVLFGHSVGMPRDPCLNADDSPNYTCQGTSPDFHVPRTNSGVADFPGGDVLVALGAFEDEQKLPVGTTFMQGSTLMHELGHNFELTHAGLQSLDPAIPREPNCKPQYLSVMNYLYQLRGLPDASAALQMDYSASASGVLDEHGLSDGTAIANQQYRMGWYAPLAGSYLGPDAAHPQGLAQAAKKHCDGSDLVPGETPMVRVDAPGVSIPIDWNANGSLSDGAVPEDANFDGKQTSLNGSPSDWANIRPTQLGSRRSPGGYYYDNVNNQFKLGPLSLDIGRGDIGRGDIGRGDIGRGDIGRGDIGRGDIGRGDIGVAIGRGDIGRGDIGVGDVGRGDIGRGDIGRGDIGRGDIGRGVFGAGDLDVGGPNEPFGEVDLETARAVSGNAPPPPSELTACPTAWTELNGYQCAEGGNRPVLLGWTVPGFGQPVSYSIYRFNVGEGPFPPATLGATLIGTVVNSNPAAWQPPPTRYLDTSAAPFQTVAYYVVANFADGSSSGISNFATVVTPGLIGTILQLTPQSMAAGSPPPGSISGGYFGQPVRVGTQLNVAVPSGAATGTLTVSLDGNTLVTGVPLTDTIDFPSAVYYPAPLSAGNHALRVDYSGDASYAPTSVTGNIYVTSPIPYGSSQYSIVCDTVSDWNAATAYAASIRYGTNWGHLATITSGGEDGTVMGLVEEAKAKCLDPTNPTNANLAYFLGGTRTTVTPGAPAAGWTWITGEPWSYTNWGSVFGTQEPNNQNGTENTLLYWATHGLGNGGWGDGTTNPVGGYVIEFEPSY